MVADGVAVLGRAATTGRTAGEEQRLEQSGLAGEIWPDQRGAARSSGSVGHARLLPVQNRPRAAARERPAGLGDAPSRMRWSPACPPGATGNSAAVLTARSVRWCAWRTQDEQIPCPGEG